MVLNHYKKEFYLWIYKIFIEEMNLKLMNF